MSAARAVTRRAVADSRIRNVSFAGFLGLIAFANVVGYRHTYPTLKERLAFAASFGTNKAVELFYGHPHDLLTVGGYTAWRVGGIGAIIAAVWGLLAAVRALRTEEESGRQELVLAGVLERRAAYLAAVAAIGAGGALLWLALTLGLAAGRLPVGGSAYLALATIASGAVFAGVGAVASQLAATRRVAVELSAAVLVLAFLLRTVADISSGLGGLRWATPLGWSEELRPFADPRPAVLVLPAVTAALLFVAGEAIARGRDVGTGLIQGRDSSEPRLRLLSSPAALALRSQRGSLAGWLAGTGVFALVVGLLSTSFTSANIPESLRRELHKLGGASITTPAGALGFYFVLFVFAFSLFACSQIAAARREEADQELETLLALPVSRTRWLVGRILLAAGCTTFLAFSTGLLAWAGAAGKGAHVSLPRMLEAGANSLPVAFLFLALAAFAFALVPRASVGIAYGLVSVAFVWELFGALLGAPRWLLDLTPYQHVGLVPAQPFRAAAAGIMLGIAAGAAASAVALFRRRDLAGA